MVSIVVLLDGVLNNSSGYQNFVRRIYIGTESTQDTRSILSKAAFDMGNDNICFGVGSGNFTEFSEYYYMKKNHVDQTTEYYEKKDIKTKTSS